MQSNDPQMTFFYHSGSGAVRDCCRVVSYLHVCYEICKENQKVSKSSDDQWIAIEINGVD